MCNKRIKKISQKTTICLLTVVLFQILSGCQQLFDTDPKYSGMYIYNYLSEIPENVCYKSSEPGFVVYCKNSRVVGKADTIDGAKEFVILANYENVIYANFGEMPEKDEISTTADDSLEFTCNYLEEDTIIFKIAEQDIGKYFSPEVKTLCLRRSTLTEEDKVIL